jgi:hypothetical protein
MRSEVKAQAGLRKCWRSVLHSKHWISERKQSHLKLNKDSKPPAGGDRACYSGIISIIRNFGIYNDCQVHDSDRGYVGHGPGQVYKDESPSSSSLPSRDGDGEDGENSEDGEDGEDGEDDEDDEDGDVKVLENSFSFENGEHEKDRAPTAYRTKGAYSCT